MISFESINYVKIFVTEKLHALSKTRFKGTTLLKMFIFISS